jgi:dihydrodipicolinate synthase/N-acetylneuraminate lyase
VFPQAIKAALHLQGICEPWVTPPTAALDDAAMARLRELLAEWGLLSTRGD